MGNITSFKNAMTDIIILGQFVSITHQYWPQIYAESFFTCVHCCKTTNIRPIFYLNRQQNTTSRKNQSI